MIFLLHGENTEAAYAHLRAILSSYRQFHQVKLSKDNTEEDFYLAVFSKDIVNPQKVIICENFLTSKKIKTKTLKQTPAEATLILWEKTQLPQKIVSSLPAKSKIALFKPEPQIFRFLDSISPDVTKTLSSLSLLEESKTHLLSNLENRMLLLILSKLKADIQTASKTTGRNILDWQWNKIAVQSSNFDLKTLLSLYTGAVKIDKLLKTGATDLKEKDLIMILFLKYLQNSPTVAKR